jgi:hypothetical protein
MAPCGGSSGLPKEIAAFSGTAPAAVMVAAVMTAPAAVAANASRLDITINLLSIGGGADTLEVDALQQLSLSRGWLRPLNLLSQDIVYSVN